MKLFNIRRSSALVAAAMLIAGSGSALAADLKVSLTGAEETPPVTTPATASGTITISVAHIHVGAPGQSGPPIITLSKGDNGVWSVPAGSKLTDEQYADFKAGKLYVNVHSAEHKAGEIRGQLKP